MDSQRSVGIDVARGLGIVMVVVGHAGLLSGKEVHTVFSFLMPLFFFLSGLFLRESADLRDFAVSRAHSLLKPFFVTLLAYGLAKTLLAAWRGDASGPGVDFLLGALWGNGRTIPWSAMWFVPHLFVSLLLSLLVLRVLRGTRARWAYAAVALALGVPLMDVFFLADPSEPLDGPWQSLVGLPFTLDAVFVSSAYVVAGFLCRDRAVRLRAEALPGALALAVFVGLHLAFDENVDLNMRDYGQPLVTTLQSALGIYLVLVASLGLARVPWLQRWLTQLGTASLFILLWHTPVLPWTTKMLMPWVPHPAFAALGATLAGLMLPVLLLQAVARAPWLRLLFLPPPASGQRLGWATPLRAEGP